MGENVAKGLLRVIERLKEVLKYVSLNMDAEATNAEAIEDLSGIISDMYIGMEDIVETMEGENN